MTEERTSATDALESLAWTLTFRRGETAPLDQVATSAGMAWATARKYTKAIEMVQKLAPVIEVTEDGIQVGKAAPVMEQLLQDPASALATYLLVQAPGEDATEPLDRSTHEETLSRFETEIDSMEKMGWIERTEERIRLTPLGVSVAGPHYSEIMNADRDASFVRESRHGSEVRAVIEETRDVLAPSVPDRLRSSSTWEANMYDSGQGGADRTKSSDEFETEGKVQLSGGAATA